MTLFYLFTTSTQPSLFYSEQHHRTTKLQDRLLTVFFQDKHIQKKTKSENGYPVVVYATRKFSYAGSHLAGQQHFLLVYIIDEQVEVDLSLCNNFSTKKCLLIYASKHSQSVAYFSFFYIPTNLSRSNFQEEKSTRTSTRRNQEGLEA